MQNNKKYYCGILLQVWERVMPEWMNAIRSNVPHERLREFKSLLRYVVHVQRTEKSILMALKFRFSLVEKLVFQAEGGVFWVRPYAHALPRHRL